MLASPAVHLIRSCLCSSRYSCVPAFTVSWTQRSVALMRLNLRVHRSIPDPDGNRPAIGGTRAVINGKLVFRIAPYHDIDGSQMKLAANGRKTFAGHVYLRFQKTGRNMQLRIPVAEDHIERRHYPISGLDVRIQNRNSITACVPIARPGR